MRNTQRGALSADLLAYLSIALMLLTWAVPLAQQELTNYVTSQDIKRRVRTIVELSRHHYTQLVLTSRCLPQTALSINNLSTASTDGFANYSVGYIAPASVKSQPLGIEVRVNFIDIANMKRVVRFLTPSEYQGSTLIFRAPLNYSLPDWQQLDVSTGCIR